MTVMEIKQATFTAEFLFYFDFLFASMEKAKLLWQYDINGGFSNSYLEEGIFCLR